MFTYESNWLALVNIFLGVAGFSWLLLRTTQRWGEYPREVKMHLVVTLAFVFALLETSFEQLAYGEPVSFNSVVIFFVKAFLVFVLWKTGGTLYRTGERSPGDGDETNPNRNVAASHQSPPRDGKRQPDALASEEDPK